MESTSKRSSAITPNKAQASAAVLDKETKPKKKDDETDKNNPVVDLTEEEIQADAAELFGDDDSDESDYDFKIEEDEGDSSSEDGGHEYSDYEAVDVAKLPPKMRKIVEDSKKADAEVIDLDAIGEDEDDDEDEEDDEDEDADDDSMLDDDEKSGEPSERDEDFLLRNPGEDDDDNNSMVADDLEALSEGDEDGKGRRLSPFRKLFHNMVKHHVYQFYSRYDDIMNKNIKSDEKTRKHFKKCADDAKTFNNLCGRTRETIVQTVADCHLIHFVNLFVFVKRIEVYQLDAIFANAKAEAEPEVPRCVVTDRKFEKSGPYMGNLVWIVYTNGKTNLPEERMYYMSKIAIAFFVAVSTIQNFRTFLDRHIAKKLDQYMNEDPNMPPTHYINKYLDDDLVDNVGTLYEVFNRCREAVRVGLKVPDYFEPGKHTNPESYA